VMSYPSTQQSMYGYSQNANTAGQWGGYVTQPQTSSVAQNQWSGYYQQAQMNQAQTASVSNVAHPTATATGSTAQPMSGYSNQSSGYYALTTQPTQQATVATTATQSVMPAGYGAIRTTGGLGTVNARYHPYQINPSQTQ